MFTVGLRDPLRRATNAGRCAPLVRKRSLAWRRSNALRTRTSCHGPNRPPKLSGTMPALSVVIPTRNRAAEAAEAARAVLCDQSDFELVVVDQSTNEATVDALRELQDEPRLRVVRSSLRGASNARNTGVAATSAPIIAFTDDDCRPAPDWAAFSSANRVQD